MGDFNQIPNNSEKHGGHSRDESTFRDFKIMLDACDMLDIKHIGNRVSWSGKISVIRNGIRSN